MQFVEDSLSSRLDPLITLIHRLLSYLLLYLYIVLLLLLLLFQ